LLPYSVWREATAWKPGQGVPAAPERPDQNGQDAALAAMTRFEDQLAARSRTVNTGAPARAETPRGEPNPMSGRVAARAEPAQPPARPEAPREVPAVNPKSGLLAAKSGLAAFAALAWPEAPTADPKSVLFARSPGAAALAVPPWPDARREAMAANPTSEMSAARPAPDDVAAVASPSSTLPSQVLGDDVPLPPRRPRTAVHSGRKHVRAETRAHETPREPSPSARRESRRELSRRELSRREWIREELPPPPPPLQISPPSRNLYIERY
jgi:hypothetical protein